MSKEKRQLKDRRAKSTRPVSSYSIFGRRRGSRRNADDKSYYVDRYEFRYLFLIMSILILCVLDIYFTLRLLQLGANEMNPIMSILIQKQPALSLILKYLITAGSLVFLLIHKNFVIFGRLKVSNIFYLVFSLYLILMVYEIYFFVSHVLM